MAGYLRQVWDRMEQLYKGKHGFRQCYSCKSQTEFVRTFLILWMRARTDAIMTDFTEAFDLVLHDWQITKTAASGVDKRVDVWVKGVPLRSSTGI